MKMKTTSTVQRMERQLMMALKQGRQLPRRLLQAHLVPVVTLQRELLLGMLAAHSAWTLQLPSLQQQQQRMVVQRLVSLPNSRQRRQRLPVQPKRCLTSYLQHPRPLLPLLRHQQLMPWPRPLLGRLCKQRRRSRRCLWRLGRHNQMSCQRITDSTCCCWRAAMMTC